MTMVAHVTPGVNSSVPGLYWKRSLPRASSSAGFNTGPYCVASRSMSIPFSTKWPRPSPVVLAIARPLLPLALVIADHAVDDRAIEHEVDLFELLELLGRRRARRGDRHAGGRRERRLALRLRRRPGRRQHERAARSARLFR